MSAATASSVSCSSALRPTTRARLPHLWRVEVAPPRASAAAASHGFTFDSACTHSPVAPRVQRRGRLPWMEVQRVPTSCVSVVRLEPGPTRVPSGSFTPGLTSVAAPMRHARPKLTGMNSM
eukprot:4024792-Prymnesium_polylepis.1